MKWFKRLVNYIFGTRVEKKPIYIEPSKPRPLEPKKVLGVGHVGVDISHHNKNVDLFELSKEVDFIYMKATEGTTFVSNVYEERAKELKKLKTPWGAYHYYRVKSSPEKQAEHFLKYIDVESGLPPVLDIEEINNKFRSPSHTEDILKFLQIIEKETGITPMIYTSFYYARDVIKPTENFKRFPLWLAWYTNDFTKVKCPKPWDNIKVWQMTENAHVTGVKGEVDFNKVIC